MRHLRRIVFVAPLHSSTVAEKVVGMVRSHTDALRRWTAYANQLPAIVLYVTNDLIGLRIMSEDYRYRRMRAIHLRAEHVGVVRRRPSTSAGAGSRRRGCGCRVGHFVNAPAAEATVGRRGVLTRAARRAPLDVVVRQRSDVQRVDLRSDDASEYVSHNN